MCLSFRCIILLLNPHPRAALLIAIIFSIGVLVQQIEFPLIEGSDETLHYAYIEQLRATWTLPDRFTSSTNATRQESSQPPLTYVTAAVIADVLGLARLPDPADQIAAIGKTRNPWNTPETYWNQVDNRNFYYASHPADPNIETALRILRLTSLGYGLIAIAAAYNAGYEIFRSRHWAALTMAFFAFMPTFIHSASYLNNDITVTAFATLTLWLSLRMIRTGASLWLVLFIDLFSAFAALSKVSGVSVIAAAGLGFVITLVRHRIAWHRIIGLGIVFLLPTVVLFGGWALYGQITYGDPFGFNTHTQNTSYTFFSSPAPAPQALVSQLPNLFITYFARFGLSIPLDPLVYALFAFAVGAAALGWMTRGRSLLRWTFHHDQALVLGTSAVMTLIGLARWMQILPAIPARLLYTAHLSIVIALVGGIRMLVWRFPPVGKAIAVFTFGLVSFAGLLGGTLAIHTAYTAPEAISVPNGETVFQFDSVSLVSWTISQTRLESAWFPVTVCWEASGIPVREPAYTIKLIDDDGAILSERTTLFGLGLRAGLNWHIGDRFCDTLEIALSERSMRPAHAYNVVLSLLDAQTQEANIPATAPDGTQTNYVLLGRVYSPSARTAPDFPLQSVTAAFPFAALQGYTLAGRLDRGETLSLTLVYLASEEAPIDYAQFIHLIGDTSAIELGSGRPNDGQYPTRSWRRGEFVTVTWSFRLPTTLATGTYKLGIGFFDPNSGMRATALQYGRAAVDNIVILETFEVR